MSWGRRYEPTTDVVDGNEIIGMRQIDEPGILAAVKRQLHDTYRAYRMHNAYFDRMYPTADGWKTVTGKTQREAAQKRKLSRLWLGLKT